MNADRFHSQILQGVNDVSSACICLIPLPGIRTDITKNMDISWQVELEKPLDLNGVIIREVWLPQEALMETVPTTETKDTWENLMG